MVTPFGIDSHEIPFEAESEPLAISQLAGQIEMPGRSGCCLGGKAGTRSSEDVKISVVGLHVGVVSLEFEQQLPGRQCLSHEPQVKTG